MLVSFLCPGGRILLCLGANYFVVLGKDAGGCAGGCPGHAIHLSGTKNNALLGSRLFCHCWCGRPWVCIVPYLCQGARIWLCLGANYFVVLDVFVRGCECGCPGHAIHLSRSRNIALLGSKIFCEFWCWRAWVCMLEYSA